MRVDLARIEWNARAKAGERPSDKELRDIQERLERREAFETLRRAVCKWWPKHWQLWNAQLGAVATLNFASIPHCIALFTMGESGRGKNMQVKPWACRLGHHPRVMRIDKFTIAGLLSGYSEKDSSELEQQAMFRLIKHNILITPELGRIFRGRTAGVLEERFSELAGWLDGEGISQVTGTHGRQGGTGDYTCVWFGGTTPFHIQVWRTMERLGQRLLFMPALEMTAEEEVAGEDSRLGGEEIHTALQAFLDVLFKQHKSRSVPGWSRWRSPEVDAEIRRLCDLLSDGHVIKGAFAGPLEPATRPDAKHHRSRIQEIVSGAVWASGRETGDASDIRDIVRPIVERSMPESRGPVLLALYDKLQTAAEIAERTKLSIVTVNNTLKDLKTMEVVTSEEAIPAAATAAKWRLSRRS